MSTNWGYDSSNIFNIFSVAFNPWPVSTETTISSAMGACKYLLSPAVVAAEVGST
jgi:hypothetical protein